MNALWSTITEATVVLGHANVGFVVAAVTVETLSTILIAYRWRLLLRSFGSGAGLWQTVLAYMSGVCVSNITPARAIGGDACRVALIRGPAVSPPLKAIAASVFSDRVADFAGILFIALLALPLTGGNWPRWAGLALLAVAAALMARPFHRRLASRIDQWNQAGAGRAAPSCRRLCLGRSGSIRR